jgi:hypothetical protein
MRTKAQRERTRRAWQFGAEAEAVKLLPCIVQGHAKAGRCIYRTALVDHVEQHVSDPSHIVTCGASGGRMDIVPKCRKHHTEFHTIGVISFGEKYGLDLRALADERALEWPRPLGIRGLADRASWHWRHDEGQVMLDDSPGPDIEGYDERALMAWVRRRMAAERDRLYSIAFDDVDGARTADECEEYSARHTLLMRVVLDDMGWDYHERWSAAHALCTAAGWPS